jgi:hypothetical protein
MLALLSFQIEAETPMPVNKDYFQFTALQLFDKALANEAFEPYAEIKSEYSSDFRGVARISAESIVSLHFVKMEELSLSDFGSIAKSFPDVVSPDLGMPNSWIRVSLEEDRGEALLYRFDDGTAVLVIQDY